VLPPTTGDQKEVIREALDRLRAGGSTAGADGIETAYRLAAEHYRPGGINRVLLATDGDFNVGPSSEGELLRLIEEKRDDGTFLTVLGFGTGNLQDRKMEQLANHGNGSYQYIDSQLEARKVLVEELGGTLQTIAKDVKIQVEFNPAEVAAYRLIGYENRLLAAEDFADDTKDAGELGAGHSVTALYEIIPVGVESDTEVQTTGDLRYQQRDTTATAQSGEWLFTRLRYKPPTGSTSRLIEQPFRPDEGAAVSDDFQFSAGVAAFGMILRDSSYRGEADYEQVLSLANDGLGPDDGGYRTAFLDLVRQAQRIAEGTDPEPRVQRGE
jgi:Ca-activated chloride channel family protein